ncbi:MAG TPA: hypothetical protein VG711_05600 [Phycisphaerales bacterium]|nr:hypothetical protein [Phycisphaerales bacterium]
MDKIHEILKVAAGRIGTTAYLAALHRVAIVVAAIALALMVSDRVGESSWVPWKWVAPALAIAAAAAAYGFWMKRKATQLHLAVRVDETLDLKEKLSTALLCEQRTDPFARAAVLDAVTTASDPKMKETLKRRMKIGVPRLWWISPVLVLAALIGIFVHPLNLFARSEADEGGQTVKQAKEEVNQKLEAVVKALDDKTQLKKELGDIAGEIGKNGLDPKALRTPEDMKRDALKKISDLNKKLDDILNGEKAKTKDAIDKAMTKISTPKDGPAKDLAEALAQGNFNEAQKAVQDLMKQVQEGKLDQKQMEEAAKQLQQIADQMKQAAEQQQKLQEALKQAGMDPQLANNPQALQQALQQNKNLNEQQKQQLQQQAQAQQQAQQMMQQMAQNMQQMAQAMQQCQQCQGGQQGQNPGGQAQQQQAMQQAMQAMQQAGQQAGDQLSQMEQLQQLLDEAQAAMNAANQEGQGLGQQMAMQQSSIQQDMKGPGMGKRGQGSGGKATKAPTPTGTVREKANIKTVQGDIIGKTLFQGPQTRGESRTKIAQVVQEEREGFDEALEDDEVLKKYSDPMKHYFGELAKQTDVTSSQSKTVPAEDAQGGEKTEDSGQSASDKKE